MSKTLAQWLTLIESYHPSEIELGLARLQKVWQAMACPVNAKVVTVAGTNGKGSTCAYIDALLSSHGAKVGRYSSPHFHRFNERILIAGEPVTDDALVTAFEVVDQARRKTPLTYFEFTTLAAFYLYSQASLDVWVLEIGLGGRLDAVNIIDPDVSVLTSVGLDHQGYLGDTLAEIGREKAGICRAGRPFVIGLEQPPESVLQVAESTGAKVLQRGVDFTDQGPLVLSNGAQFECPAVKLPTINIVTALQAVQCIQPLDKHKVAEALANAQLVGRMQSIARNGCRFLLDVAHNPQAAENLCQQLAGQQFAIVFAGLADKDLAGVVKALSPLARDWYFAGLDVPRGLSAEQLRGLMNQNGHFFDQPEQAISAAAKSGANVLVCGSFYTVSAALSWLNKTND